MIVKKIGRAGIASILLAFFILCLAGCSQKPAVSNKPLAMDRALVTGKLDNGLSYFIQRNTEPENRVLLRLVVRAGSNMEEDDQKGVAHFVEHLAFNGSENFDAGALVDYFETIGMNFGADVNAYTSFDETVYMIEVPSDDPAMLDTGMLVLRDWACGLSFHQEELDKERGVVVEEWRLGRGISGRIHDAIWPFVLKGSRYAQRLPIGDMDIIQSIPRQRVVDFYEKWYRPELMSVVVVGDTEPERIQDLIQEMMGGIPVSQEPVEPEVYSVPPQTEPAVLVLRDSEQPYQSIQILEQKDRQPVTTEGLLRRQLVSSITSSILNLRLAELAQSEDSPWVDAAIFDQGITNHTLFHSMGLIPLSNEFPRGFTALLEEFLRYKEFGVLQSELDRTKESIMASVEQLWKNKDKINSSAIASSIVDHIVSGDTVISVDDRYTLYSALLPSITLEEVNEAAATWFQGLGTLLFAAIPENTQGFPSDQELLSLWQNFKPTRPLEPYSEDEVAAELVAAPPAPGTVTPEGTLPGTEILSYRLSNGATLLLHKTDFKNSEVLFNAVSAGGLSLVDDQEHPSGAVATSYNDYSGLGGFTPTALAKKLAGKNVSLSTHLGEYSEGLTGSASAKDLETLLQLVYLQFTAPEFTAAGWDNLMKDLSLSAENYGNHPNDVMESKLVELLYGDSLRKAPLTKELMKKLDRDSSERIFRQRFADAGDFTFIFTGDFDQEELLGLAATYLATLPATNAQEESPWRELPFPQSIQRAAVYKGMEEQSQVLIVFGGQLPQADAAQAQQEALMLSVLQNLLDIKLREVIREEKGGTYGVGVQGSMVSVPQRKFTVEIWFGCKPGQEEQLAEQVLKEIAKLQTDLVADSYVTKLQEGYRRTKETSLKTNDYWSAVVGSAVLRGFPTTAITDMETIPALVTPEGLRQLARTYLDLDNYVMVFLEPESARK